MHRAATWLAGLPARLERDVKLYMAGAALIGFAAFGIYSVLFNLYLLRMGYGVDSIGQINAAGLLAFALFSPVAGHWARRAGCRRVLVGGAALMAAGYLLMSLAGFLPGSVRAGWIVSVKVVISCGFAAYMVNSSPFLMQEWGETRMPEGAHYEQEQEILKTEVRGNMAITVVRESGRWRSDSGKVYVRWDDTRNVWFTGRIKGEWKIIAAFFPEVTPRTQS